MTPVEAVIVAGGLGSRLRPLTDHRPKHLLPVAGIALVAHQLAKLAEADVRRVILATSYHADQFEPTVGALIDLPEVMKYLAVQRASGEIDGLIGNWSMSNFYLYRFRDGRPSQLLPWDADHSLWALDDPIDYRIDTNVLVARAMAVPGLRRLYLETLASTARLMTEAPDATGRGWLEREVDRLAAKITPAVVADPVAPFTFAEFEGNVRGLRGFLRTRPPYVDCAAGAALDPTAAQSCPLPVYVEIAPPGRLPR